MPFKIILEVSTLNSPLTPSSEDLTQASDFTSPLSLQKEHPYLNTHSLFAFRGRQTSIISLHLLFKWPGVLFMIHVTFRKWKHVIDDYLKPEPPGTKPDECREGTKWNQFLYTSMSSLPLLWHSDTYNLSSSVFGPCGSERDQTSCKDGRLHRKAFWKDQRY